MQSMSSQASSWTLMEDFFVQECCVHGTDLENHGPTSILCDDPLPIESIVQPVMEPMEHYTALVMSLVSGTARGSSCVVYQHKPSMALVVTWCPNTAKSIPLFATLICGSGNFKRTSRNLRKTWEQRFRISLTCALFSSS